MSMKSYFQNNCTLPTMWPDKFCALGQNFEFKLQVVIGDIKYPLLFHEQLIEENGRWAKCKLNMVYYIFCSCLFIFVWLFIGFLFFLKSRCQNNYGLGINFDKKVISFLCFLNLPSHQTSKIMAQWFK